ncbi:hypothetical protein FPE01S_04_00380 [Flavihumibacter petaseus NBRC 106054]|uniref:Tetratricopeptide repeat protein n=2 Tax=Flavihumibacter TaxID=1004301 RepID=A0A0E9N613_9BACT|nr:hypothetical protein FPE01S_04_00380 [Flavihumibacter petaseus NBRC 106054]
MLGKRIEKDLEQRDLLKAISRLEGAIRCNPLDKDLNCQLANLYFKNNDLVKAGKLWYLNLTQSESELVAVKSFTNSLGNDPTLILRKLLNRQFFRLNLLEEFQLEKLATLLEAVRKKEEKMPRFLYSLDSHIKGRKRKYSR